MSKILLLLLTVCSLSVFGQKEKVITIPIDAWGHTYQAVISLPPDSNGKLYPILIFLHGREESTNNLSSIYANSGSGGPAYFIEKGELATNKMIVVSPQAAGSGWSSSAEQLDYMLKDLVKKYNVDPSRIHLTGLSAGGDGVTKYLLGNYTYKPASAVIMSQAGGIIDAAGAKAIADKGTALWVFSGTLDNLYPNNKVIVEKVNAIVPGRAISTYYNAGHCCWNNYYNPAFKQNGLSIYDWMLQFQQGTTPVVIPPVIVPKVIAGRVFLAGWEFVLYTDGSSESKK